MNLNITLQLQPNDFVAVYGKSGAGKTTLLKILAGLIQADQGKIICQGQPWLDTHQRINLKPQQRSVGLLFQDYALFPNMTVKENLTYALRKGQKTNIIQDLLELMELGELQHRKPEVLSGGQKQRVALARALVQRPKLLLLDEPLAALDLGMRQKLQDYLLKIHQEFQLTTVLVSHDIAEIFKLTNRVIVLDQGQIKQQGKPIEIFQNREVSGKFQFIGEIIALEDQDFLRIISLLIGQEIVRVIADQTEVKGLMVGDKVMVASKAFNPIIKKML